MDSVLMTSPSNSTRFKTRLRSAPSVLLARHSKAKMQNRNQNLKNSAKSGLARPSVQRNSQNCGGKGNTHCTNNNHQHFLNRGKFTREIYNAIFGRLGHTPHIPGESVQALFNDLQLYPSKSQVSEMLQCARQCSRRQNGSLHLTFGEFCVLVREMQKPEHRHHRKAHGHQKNKCTKNCEVFLGGSCNPTTWRTDTAIPELQKHGITYYNPQVSTWAPELIAQEHDAKQSASVLLYVVDNQTRNVVGMIEVAYLVAARRCVILVAYPYRLGQTIMGEQISYEEYQDLANGQISLLALVKSQGVKVHNHLTSALQCTANVLRNSGGNGLTAEEQVVQKLRKLRETFDAYDTNKMGELYINDILDAYKSLTNKSLDLKSLYTYLSASNHSDPSRMRISFEQFCALVAEFTTNGCDQYINMNVANDWARQPVSRQCTLNTNSQVQNFSTKSSSFLADVYLGGSCNSKSLWREKIAIPALKKQGLSYYNPAIRETNLIDFENLINSENLTNGENTSNCLNITNGLNGDNVINGENLNGENIYGCSIKGKNLKGGSVKRESKKGGSIKGEIINGENVKDENTNGDSSYINSDNQTMSVSENEILQWKKTMDRSRVLLFVITDDTRSLTTMVMAAHYIGLDSTDKEIILCVQALPLEDFEISNEKLTKQAIKDYNRGRVYLSDLAKRKQIPVFENITDAVNCAIDKCQQNR